MRKGPSHTRSSLSASIARDLSYLYLFIGVMDLLDPFFFFFFLFYFFAGALFDGYVQSTDLQVLSGFMSSRFSVRPGIEPTIVAR